MGISLALLTAFFVSLRSSFEKFALKEIDEITVGLGFRFFAFLFLAIFIAIFGIEVQYDATNLMLPLLIGGSLNVLSTIFMLKALKKGDLSLVGPLAALTPLFILLTSPFIIGQFPSRIGFFGVILSVVGAICLNYKNHNLKDSLMNSINKKNGSFYALMAALSWSVSSSIDKIGVTYSNPFVWSLLINLYVVIALVVYLSFKDIEKVNIFKNEFTVKHLIISGLFAALASVTQNYAYGFILVVYVISIKRLSSVFEVFIGHFILKENHFKQRLLGSLIMVIGSILILFSNGG